MKQLKSLKYISVAMLLYGQTAVANWHSKYYLNFDSDNKPFSISQLSMQKDSIELLQDYQSYITPTMESGKLKACNKSFTCHEMYDWCGKGLLGGMNGGCNKSQWYDLNSIIVRVSRNDDGTVKLFETTILNFIIVPVATLFGTTLIENKFNTEKYNNFINKYSLETNKKDIFNLLDNSTTEYYICDVSKLANEDLKVSKISACRTEDDKGLFLFNGFEGNWLSEGNARFITLLSADELKFPIFATQKITQKLVDEYMDLDKIVPEVALPDILPEVALEKSDFEKQADFEKRKSQAIEKRENEQKLINEKYIKDVKERNEKYFDEATKRRATLDEKMDEFRKQAFLSISKTPLFEYESYDAETEKMYGFLINGEEKRKVVLQMNGNEAKKITENLKNIIPSIEYELKKENELSSFEIKKLTLALDGKTYIMGYTDVNYKPTYMAVTIPSYDMSLYDASIKDALKDSGTLSQNELKALQNVEQWRQKSMTGISDTTIIHTNAKAPNWYEKIECGDTVCGVGRATTQQEALKIAMNQVGCSIKASVSSKLNVQKTNNNGYLSKVATYDLKQTCDNQFNNGEIAVTNSAEMDGWYYVRTVLNKK